MPELEFVLIRAREPSTNKVFRIYPENEKAYCTKEGNYRLYFYVLIRSNVDKPELFTIYQEADGAFEFVYGNIFPRRTYQERRMYADFFDFVRGIPRPLSTWQLLLGPFPDCRKICQTFTHEVEIRTWGYLLQPSRAFHFLYFKITYSRYINVMSVPQ